MILFLFFKAREVRVDIGRSKGCNKIIGKGLWGKRNTEKEQVEGKGKVLARPGWGEL